MTSLGMACRHELYTDYKAQRPPMPDAMKLAIPKIQQLLQVCISNVTSVYHDQFTVLCLDCIEQCTNQSRILARTMQLFLSSNCMRRSRYM